MSLELLQSINNDCLTDLLFSRQVSASRYLERLDQYSSGYHSFSVIGDFLAIFTVVNDRA